MSLDSTAALVEFVRAELTATSPELDVEGLDAGTSLSELGVDSVALAGIVAAIEDDLGIVLPEDELIEVDSLGALAKVVERHAPAWSD